jgi:hypothetical protein
MLKENSTENVCEMLTICSRVPEKLIVAQLEPQGWGRILNEVVKHKNTREEQIFDGVRARILRLVALTVTAGVEPVIFEYCAYRLTTRAE